MKISSNWERQIPVAEFQLVLLSGYVLVGSGGRVSGRTGSHEGNDGVVVHHQGGGSVEEVLHTTQYLHQSSIVA